MKVLFILINLAYATPIKATDATDLLACIHELKEITVYYQKRLPFSVIISDRKLLMMIESIWAMEENASLAARQSKVNFLIQNGTQNCQSFSTQYSNQFKSLFLFFYSMVFLISCIGISFIVHKFFPPNKSKVQHHNDKLLHKTGLH